MRSLILLLVIMVALLSIAGAAAWSHKPESEVAVEPKPWLQPEADDGDEYPEHCCGCDDCEQNGCEEIGEEEAASTDSRPVSRDQMIREVEMLWDMWFDDEGAKDSDPRRERFPEFAEYVADAVIMYQNTQTDIGGQLPKHKDDHLVMAFMAAKESSVTFDVVGTSHQEVGLMQLHGVALAGYAPEKVQHNPKLGVLLGVRWLTAQLPKCEQEGAGIFGDQFAWETSDWIGPLSVYAGGPNGIRKDGRCARFSKMRERIDKVRFYRTRIDHALEYGEE